MPKGISNNPEGRPPTGNAREKMSIYFSPRIVELAKAILGANYAYYQETSGHSAPGWARVAEEAIEQMAERMGVKGGGQKAADHQKIVRRIVARKNEEAAAIREILEADKDFWLSEAASANQKLSEAIELLEAAQKSINDDQLAARIAKFIESAWK